MKRNATKIILAALLCTLLAIGVTGCIIPDVDDGEHIHSFGEWETTKEPTCTDAGERVHTCTECGETETEIVKALGHDEKSFESKAPTCTEDGYTAYTECTRCGASTKEVVEALGHEWNDWTVTTDGHYKTCMHDGCADKLCEGEHTFENSKNCCDSCGAVPTDNVWGYIASSIEDETAETYDIVLRFMPDATSSAFRDVAGALRYADSGTVNLTICGIETIPERALSGSGGALLSVTFGEGVKTVERWVFSGCTNLKSITVSADVDDIKGGAFYGCTALEKIVIDEKNEYYMFSDPGDLYSKDGKVLVMCRSLGDGDFFLVPDGVTTIASYAFADYTSLVNVSLPATVTEIGENAFAYCSALEAINLDNVKIIGATAFYGCRSLVDVTLPESLETIGEQAFYSSGIKTVEIPKNVTSIGSRAFHRLISEINVDEENETYKSVDGNLYSKDGKILIQYATGKTETEFTVPEGVETIAEHAFRESSSLSSITLPSTLENIEPSAFFKCNFKAIVIPVGVKYIGWTAFGSSSLKNITFTGTMEEWNAIEKSSAWAQSTYIESIVCSDGTIQ